MDRVDRPKNNRAYLEADLEAELQSLNLRGDSISLVRHIIRTVDSLEQYMDDKDKSSRENKEQVFTDDLRKAFRANFQEQKDKHDLSSIEKLNHRLRTNLFLSRLWK